MYEMVNGMVWDHSPRRGCEDEVARVNLEDNNYNRCVREIAVLVLAAEELIMSI